MRLGVQYVPSDDIGRAASVPSAPAPQAPVVVPADLGEGIHLALLVKAIEHEIIPRLMVAHRISNECLSPPAVVDMTVSAQDIEQFARLVLSPDDGLAHGCLQVLRNRGIGVETLCLDLLAPVARHLGALWENDLCDFTDVTMGLGRLHQLLRELSPAFDQQQDAPANGRRILLAPAPGEQHTFGLVMVGEFFRRAGWEVEAALGDVELDAETAVASGWFDVAGFGLAAEIHLEDLANRIRAVRAASMNPLLCIMVGGALFAREPDRVAHVGADGASSSARDAPVLADKLVAAQSLARVGRVPMRPM